MEALRMKELPPEIGQRVDKYDLDACMTCGTCSSGCPASGTAGFGDWDIRKALRLIAFDRVEEVVDANFPWICAG